MNSTRHSTRQNRFLLKFIFLVLIFNSKIFSENISIVNPVGTKISSEISYDDVNKQQNVENKKNKCSVNLYSKIAFLKPYLLGTAVLAGSIGSAYLACKISNKVGLTKEIKTVFQAIKKTRVLKSLLKVVSIGAFAVGSYALINPDDFVDYAVTPLFVGLVKFFDPWDPKFRIL